MKLWLFDADVIIKLFELDVFDRLVMQHKVHVASTVVGEVLYYKKKGPNSEKKIPVDLRADYIIKGLITELSASPEELQRVVERIPGPKKLAIHVGELESLAVLLRDDSLTMCTFDHFAIRIIPFLGVSERAISAEKMCQESGFTLSPKHIAFDAKLTDEYFNSNLEIGKREHIMSMAFQTGVKKR